LTGKAARAATAERIREEWRIASNHVINVRGNPVTRTHGAVGKERGLPKLDRGYRLSIDIFFHRYIHTIHALLIELSAFPWSHRVSPSFRSCHLSINAPAMREHAYPQNCHQIEQRLNSHHGSKQECTSDQYRNPQTGITHVTSQIPMSNPQPTKHAMTRNQPSKLHIWRSWFELWTDVWIKSRADPFVAKHHNKCNRARRETINVSSRKQKTACTTSKAGVDGNKDERIEYWHWKT
jgi:hypothetical protein